MAYLDYLIIQLGIPLFYIKLVGAVFVSLVSCFFSIPIILKISKRKNLMNEPGIRSSHVRKIPNLGGIAIFYAIGIATPMFGYELFDLYKFLFPTLIILLYVGVMDDIVIMRAYKKLFIQIFVASLMVIGSDVRIRSLFGLFGIYELPYFISILFTIVTIIIIINSFNLIDGIDGLAGTYTIICCLLFGVSYYRLGEYNYPMIILCASIIGALIGFLYYNLSSSRSKKIFMGDTGSMIVGFLLAFTAIYFINIFTASGGRSLYHLPTAPVIAFAILILPMVDTLNVILIRLFNKKSPMEADKNHIHHKLLDLGLSHKKSTFYILCYYMFTIIVVYFFRHININLLLVFVLMLGFMGAYIPRFILKLRN
ncbi:undecaprenyl/decaprenyl-phosphate alpha-N-acetylglucosaminyl 1-phosphate transferase [Riemerella anatipestifer]|uniref:glycosyltransferase family 4 protein n=1 Tax=Riemerella anatipestifer TaxID=34085 RepID=UPI0007ECD885|nr:MraY family glycosyltransferase [Riemerella anatipestifer]AZZ58738.1 undecaprenyl/decaprenyl-phosphate alpha-N-acetylglucosaminyl 1-phosphate transferase [Riemerella anatipestifer]MCO7318763.1 undecaprenyl/decaprenyl-phosphate alpha-N-acetylglucosaminyl 1-phosphate transferase [Riemerella anatipestifer]MCQ4155063.1 undecaprenyl/decaprenyl-phosphate alpha-N-acetylglucosaminyl 1-phosphate transferase [Riemerella anatipestifer]MCQ4181037.1 undecaprenyl/decaprenyl-phosphate alpha-N-acetylglucosa